MEKAELPKHIDTMIAVGMAVIVLGLRLERTTMRQVSPPVHSSGFRFVVKGLADFVRLR